MDLFGLGSAVSGVANSITSVINTNKTNKANKELANFQYSKDLEMWNKQNQYNSPTAQMERYKTAGLNPNLIYGTGTASAGNAATMPKYQAPSAQYHYEAPNVAPALGAYMDLKAKNAQIQSINEDITAKRLQNQINTATLLDAISGKRFSLRNQENIFYGTRAKTTTAEAEAENADRYYSGRGLQEFQKGNFMQKMLAQQLANSVMANTLQGKTLEKYSADIANTNLQSDYKSMQNEWFKKGGINGLNDVLPFLKFMFNK